MMSWTRPSLFLRRALLADAAASGATGLLMAAGADAFSGPLGLPVVLLREAGLVLLPYAALLAWLGLRESLPRAAVWAVIVCNALWAAESLLLLASGWVAPTALGVAFVVAQALAVAGLAGLQWQGLRRSAPHEAHA
jgi:hypothetical protein